VEYRISLGIVTAADVLHNPLVSDLTGMHL